MNLTTILISAACASATWVVAGWRSDSRMQSALALHEKNMATCTSDVATLRAAMEDRNTQRLDSHLSAILESQKVANERKRQNSAVVVSNRNLAVGMQCPSARVETLAGGAEKPAAAALESATPAGVDVLAECAAALVDLAEKADGHVEDIRLIQSSVE